MKTETTSLSREARDAKVWQLWQRMPVRASNELWRRFNAVILRKYGAPNSALCR